MLKTNMVKWMNYFGQSLECNNFAFTKESVIYTNKIGLHQKDK